MAKSRSPRSSGVSASGGGAGGTARPSNSRRLTQEERETLSQLNMGVDLGAAGRALKGIGEAVGILPPSGPPKEWETSVGRWDLRGYGRTGTVKESLGMKFVPHPSGNPLRGRYEDKYTYHARVGKQKKSFGTRREAMAWVESNLKPKGA